MGGPGSGRHKETKTHKQSLITMALLEPKAVIVIGETVSGVNKDRLQYEAAIAIYEHNHGKAKIAIDQRIKGRILFTADDYEFALRLAESDRLLLTGSIIEGKEVQDAIQRQGATEGSSQEGG